MLPDKLILTYAKMLKLILSDRGGKIADMSWIWEVFRALISFWSPQ